MQNNSKPLHLVKLTSVWLQLTLRFKKHFTVPFLSWLNLSISDVCIIWLLKCNLTLECFGSQLNVCDAHAVSDWLLPFIKSLCPKSQSSFYFSPPHISLASFILFLLRHFLPVLLWLSITLFPVLPHYLFCLSSISSFLSTLSSHIPVLSFPFQEEITQPPKYPLLGVENHKSRYHEEWFLSKLCNL